MSTDDTNATSRGSGSNDLLGPVGWRYVPSEVWGDQVLTQDPKTAQLARDMGREVEPLYTEAQMLARVTAERERLRAALEWYADEARACAKNSHTGNHAAPQALLASVTVLALDGGRRADEALKA